MAKKPSVSSLKKKLDTIFSRYIRLKAVQEAMGNEYISCCSCGQVRHWKDMDAGHFASRRHNMTRYDEENVNPQCVPCNRYDEGNPAGYARFLLGKYPEYNLYRTTPEGERKCVWTILDELDYRSHQLKQFRADELLDMIEMYKAKLKEVQR